MYFFKYSCKPCPSAKAFLQEIAKEFGDGTDLHELHKRYIERYGMPQLGRHRATYIASNYVIKLPVHPDGFADNDWEGSVLSDVDRDLARTRLFYYGPYIPILFMGRVQPIYHEKEIETYGKRALQTAWATDCMQVGLSKRGNVVAFDYGLR